MGENYSGRNALTPPWWATATPTPADIAERLADLDDAIGSQRLAGLDPDRVMVAQLRRVAHGELTIEAVLADIHACIARGEL